ncbi:MAG TPA: DinB family protein [Saprospiraceae bacterium]|nr:DinB family protein [Saprospiraceae bacterium]
MALSSLRPLFRRDIHKLYREVDAYAKEEELWIVDQKISNSAGNLALHVVGNLNHFVGAQLGNTDYQRDRDFEFHGKGVPKGELLEQIESTQEMVDQVLSRISPDQLDEDYPIEVFNKKMTTEFFLIHLLGHLNYHLGQINYHRRLLATP